MSTSAAPNVDIVAVMRQLRTAGDTDAEIGRKLNLSRQRVHQLLGPSGVDRRKGPHPRARSAPSARGAFSDALLAWRLRHNLSQSQAAKILRISSIAIYSKWETLGHCSLPGLVLAFIKLWEAQQRNPKPLREISVSESLPTTLQHWRARHGLTQNQAAVILRLTSLATQAQWERGRGCMLPNLVRNFIKLWEAHKNS